MVTTNQKSTIDIPTKKKRNLNTTLKTITQLPEKRTKDKEKGKKTYKNNPKPIGRMTIRTYISVLL